MARIVINEENCKACMLCIVFCQKDCLALGDHLNSRGFHPAVVVDEERCTGCRSCALMCPDVCIEVYLEAKTSASPQAHS